MNCNKLNKVLSVSSSSYTAPTALGIMQEVEQIRANVFYSTFLNVFYIFSRTFFTSMVQTTIFDPLSNGVTAEQPYWRDGIVMA